VAPWWPACSKEAYNSGLDGMACALRNFSGSRAGRRAGRPVGSSGVRGSSPGRCCPRFKSRRGGRAAVRFTTGVIRVEADRKHVTLPRLGTIKLHESAGKLARRLERGTARILSATVSRDSRDRWQVAFCAQVRRSLGRPTWAGPAPWSVWTPACTPGRWCPGRCRA
jgi:putative transposase